jgi:YjjG family noncanonical pyrimidine nucleotidase
VTVRRASPRPSSLRAILFDLDHTLLDFDRAQRAALREALRDFSLPFAAAVLPNFRRINDELWALYRRGGIAQAALAVERFRQLLLLMDADPRRAKRLSESFLDHLGARGDRMPGCRALLASLAKRHRLGVVTNGIDRVQRSRLEVAALPRFFGVVVTSEGCGFAKPDPRILEVALRALEVRPEEALYVGDDPATDGEAAARAGVAFCWIGGKPGARGPRPRVRTLAELGRLLRAPGQRRAL